MMRIQATMNQSVPLSQMMMTMMMTIQTLAVQLTLQRVQDVERSVILY